MRAAEENAKIKKEFEELNSQWLNPRLRPFTADSGARSFHKALLDGMRGHGGDGGVKP
jgi:hypothetical protein